MRNRDFISLQLISCCPKHWKQLLELLKHFSFSAAYVKSLVCLNFLWGIDDWICRSWAGDTLRTDSIMKIIEFYLVTHFLLNLTPILVNSSAIRCETFDFETIFFETLLIRSVYSSLKLKASLTTNWIWCAQHAMNAFTKQNYMI
jgi:hypothetical protein